MEYRSFSQSSMYDPRIDVVRRQLEMLLQVVDLEKDGQKVRVDGFRLKNLSHWMSPTRLSLWGSVGSLSSYCNCRCVFCYERNTPLDRDRGNLTVEEVATRSRYYKASPGWSLPLSMRPYFEPFCNPRAIEIIGLVRREDPEGLIMFNTNGVMLTEEMIRHLANLKPVFVLLSLNSADVQLRHQTMGDRRFADTAVAAAPLLRRYGIPFHGSLVAWPCYPLEDLERTARYLDEYDAATIGLILPGYNRYNEPAHPFDTEEHWNRVVELGKCLRYELTTPVHVSPSLYWAEALTPRVDGVIRNSPAARAAAQVDDLILEIDGHSIQTRVQAANLLQYAPRDGAELCRQVKVRRNGQVIDLALVDEENPEVDCYPYKPLGYRQGHLNCYGFLFIDDFRLSSVYRLAQIIAQHNARRTLLLSSRIIKPVFEKAMRMVQQYQDFFASRELYIEIPEHRFWGGNIMLGDLYMVGDYIEHIRCFVQERGFRPDLVVIPSSTFTNRWGIDLRGQSYKDIENACQVPVELVECQQIGV